MSVNRLASVPILSQVIKIKMEVQVSNPLGLWSYLSDATPRQRQRIVIVKFGVRQRKRRKIAKK